MLLDSTNFKLTDLDNGVLADVYHINRSKLATLVTPHGYISAQKQCIEALGLNHLPTESK